MNATATAIIIRPELESAVAKLGLAADGAASLRDAFAPHFARFHDLAADAKSIEPTNAKAARALRLQVKAVRVEADKTRVDLKADSLRRSQAIDGINNVLRYSLVPVEEALQAIEDAEERAETARREGVRIARFAELAAYLPPEQFAHLDLGGMGDELWIPFLAGTKASHEAKVALAAKVEAERLEALRLADAARIVREAKEKADRELLQAENARLAQAAAEEKAKREAVEAKAKEERDAAELAAANTKKLSDAKLAAENKQRDADRVAADKVAAEERQRHAVAALAEKTKREAAEAEVQRLRDAEAAKVAAEAEAARKAKAAPDKEKVAALAKQVRALHVPALATEGGGALAGRINDQVTKFAGWLEAEAGKL